MKKSIRLIAGASVLALISAVVPVSIALGAQRGATVALQLTDSHGRPAAGQRVVVMTKWSSMAALKQYGGAEGRVVTTNAAGSARVKLALSQGEAASLAHNNGWLNLSIVTLDAAGNPSRIIAASRYLGSKPDQRAQLAYLPNQGTVEIRLPRSSRLSTSDVQPAASCTYYWELYQTSSPYVQVGELHRDKALTSAVFTYGETADSNMDVMVKSTGLGWSVEGTSHVGNSRSASVHASATTDNYHWALRSQFDFARMRLYKDCLGGPTHSFTGSEEIDPVEWAGGGMTLANTVSQSARNSSYSQTYGPNTGWSRSTSKLTRWSAAVSVFGVTVGAQSGASTEVKYAYQFGSRATYYMYGNNARPSTSTRVFQQTP